MDRVLSVVSQGMRMSLYPAARACYALSSQDSKIGALARGLFYALAGMVALRYLGTILTTGAGEPRRLILLSLGLLALATVGVGSSAYEFSTCGNTPFVNDVDPPFALQVTGCSDPVGLMEPFLNCTRTTSLFRDILGAGPFTISCDLPASMPVTHTNVQARVSYIASEFERDSLLFSFMSLRNGESFLDLLHGMCNYEPMSYAKAALSQELSFSTQSDSIVKFCRETAAWPGDIFSLRSPLSPSELSCILRDYLATWGRYCRAS